MFEICIFDLDQTLIDTEDMKVMREAGKNQNSAEYKQKITAAFQANGNRHIYKPATLQVIRNTFPKSKFCIFTRSPRSYAETVLALAYPNFVWDKIVAYEDVPGRTKPYGDGIDRCIEAFEPSSLESVVLVGDGDIDVRSAYHAGCVVIVDRSAWPNKLGQEHWRALGHIPDAIISEPVELIDVLRSYRGHLPELERALSKTKPASAQARFDRVNKFIPRDLAGDATPFPIFTGGRSFSNYESLKWRRNWHQLTASIHANKEPKEFPEEWIGSIRSFISSTYGVMGLFGGSLHITVVPHRPKRAPRLEKLLAQLENSYANTPMKGKLTLHFHPKLLAYRPGVRSNSNDKLSQLERFANVREHLYVADTKLAKKGGQFLVIDDVCTTGSTLIYAKKYLTESGASATTCFSLAMNVSDVL